MEGVQKQLRKMFIVRKGSFTETDLQKVKRIARVVATTNKNKQDSRSHKKIVDIIKESPKDNIEGYMLVDMVILRDIITNLNYPECNSKNLLSFENTQRRKGLASSLLVKCSNCEFVINRYTSSVLPPDNNPDNRGMRTFDINARNVYALRSYGVSHIGLERVCGLLNLLKPIACKHYDNISNRHEINHYSLIIGET